MQRLATINVWTQTHALLNDKSEVTGHDDERRQVKTHCEA